MDPSSSNLIVQQSTIFAVHTGGRYMVQYVIQYCPERKVQFTMRGFDTFGRFQSSTKFCYGMTVVKAL